MNTASISVRVAAASLMLAAAGAAQANCKPLFEAFEKMRNQKRVAFCLVDKLGKCLMADGKAQGDKWIDGNPMSEVAKDLREGEKKGVVKCLSAGTGKWASATVDKFETQPRSGGNISFRRGMFHWVDKASGLVVAQGADAAEPLMGYQYGDAVK